MTDPFAGNRRLLFGVAYNMLGSVADAEDVVQETWLRWSAEPREDVREPRAYLVRIASRLALNRLRDAKARRENYVGPWLPEPLITAPDVGQQVVDDAERNEAISLAMLVVLETLTPSERAVFVLREVFGMSHDEIATVLDKSPAAVRQIAHRAREHVQARRPRFDTDEAQQRAITEQFVAACYTGDIAALLRMLAPDVELVADGGGVVSTARRPVSGAAKVAPLVVGLVRKGGPGMRVELTAVNGSLGVVAYDGDRVDTIGVLEIDGGLIRRVLIVRNPEKLPVTP